ncbi:alpha/beta fold hydrolase [Demetria terragena]|uniref:alpha/beta fold hydrolase n=1 Tax=Demetria terragena TaxID=63959 RepID=UPI00036E485B|nr:alpha/beta hydrolase [Demetria terragena]
MGEPAVLESCWVDVDGTSVHYVDLPGPADGDERPTFVLVHGLGGSLVNWDSLAPLLAEHGRVLALDLGGFGWTQSADASVPANRKLLTGFIHALDLPPVVLVGNSMGGMLSAMHAVEDPTSVAQVVLVDPALPGNPKHRPSPTVAAVFSTYLVPPLSRRLMKVRATKVTPEQAVREMLALVTHDRRQVPAWLRARHIQTAQDRAAKFGADADTAFLAAAKSVVKTILKKPSYTRVFNSIDRPVLLLHGAHDRLVSVGAARAMAHSHPNWAYAEGAHLGHCPMFEDPEWVRDHILAFGQA